MIRRGLVLCQRKLIKRVLATGTGAEMRPATVCGIVTGDALVSYWPIFFSLPLVTVPGGFAGVNSVQFPLDCYQTPSSCPIVTKVARVTYPREANGVTRVIGITT